MTPGATSHPGAFSFVTAVTVVLCLLSLRTSSVMNCRAEGLIAADWLIVSARDKLQWQPVIRTPHCSAADLNSSTANLSALSNFRLAFIGDSHIRNLYNVFLDIVLMDGCGPPRETVDCKQVDLASFYNSTCGARARGWAGSSGHFPRTALGAANLSVSFTWAPRYEPFSNSTDCAKDLSAKDVRYLATQLTPTCRTAPQIVADLVNASDAVVLSWPSHEHSNARMRAILLSLVGSYPRHLIFYNYSPQVTAFSALLSKWKVPAIDVSGAIIPPVKYDASHAALPPVELAARFLLVNLLRRRGGGARRPMLRVDEGA